MELENIQKPSTTLHKPQTADPELEKMLTNVTALLGQIKVEFNSYVTKCKSYTSQTNRKLAYFKTTNLLEGCVKEIRADYEDFDKKYSKGWIWEGKEAVISEVEDGFYKLPSK